MFSFYNDPSRIISILLIISEFGSELITMLLFAAYSSFTFYRDGLGEVRLRLAGILRMLKMVICSDDYAKLIAVKTTNKYSYAKEDLEMARTITLG